MENSAIIPEKIDAILCDPCASDWLKHAIITALRRDPVDVAADAQLLHEILQEYADRILADFKSNLRHGG